MNKMMDYIDMIPILQQQSRGITHTEAQDNLDQWTDFKTNRRNLTSLLDTWFQSQQEANPVLYHAVTTESYAFAHAGDLVTMLLFWTAKLLLHNCLFVLQDCPDDCVALEATLAMDREMDAADAVVGHILKSVPWAAKPENGIMSKLFALPPLRYAARFCERWNMLHRLEECTAMDKVITSGGCERMAG